MPATTSKIICHPQIVNTASPQRQTFYHHPHPRMPLRDPLHWRRFHLTIRLTHPALQYHINTIHPQILISSRATTLLLLQYPILTILQTPIHTIVISKYSIPSHKVEYPSQHVFLISNHCISTSAVLRSAPNSRFGVPICLCDIV
ncbi:hypothetical protein PAXRUDRAFT_394228 [Paxillus rubicundulus Ve08.2h10]|uniref:Unplaced genomic scaffold scaffold_2297, whole genome shotgun sequence n=1 Tax=Paxillus rubicundulus Ve08.2h10 TaxID=930991 RepID=A0A0D0C1P5_9AGAM|nr:hypothetical protein PAXRUDRAFT_394228 [Paxillus rubicundulus Ve08.2h10]